MSDTDISTSEFEKGFRDDDSRPAAPAASDADLAPVLEKVAKRYPALAPYLADTKAQWGDSKVYDQTGNHLEFYPPWESENPNPGKITLELYDRGMRGKALEDAVAGDMLHHLGSVDPATQQPVDANWRSMRDQLIAGRDPESVAMDERAYARAVQQEGETREFNQWMDQSRADAHVRGYITPDKEDNWRNAYTADQRATLEKMKAYLAGAPQSNSSEAPGTSPPATSRGLINIPASAP